MTDELVELEDTGTMSVYVSWLIRYRCSFLEGEGVLFAADELAGYGWALLYGSSRTTTIDFGGNDHQEAPKHEMCVKTTAIGKEVPGQLLCDVYCTRPRVDGNFKKRRPQRSKLDCSRQD